jgi:hypothetical protein
MPLSKIRVLMIDRDCVVKPSLIREWVRVVVIPTCRVVGVTVESVVTCPSQRKGYHVYIYITPPVPAELAWRLQFHLGDDAKRVSLNRARMSAGFDEWNKLFERIRPRYHTIYTRHKPTSHMMRTEFDRKITDKRRS